MFLKHFHLINFKFIFESINRSFVTNKGYTQTQFRNERSKISNNRYNALKFPSEADDTNSDDQDVNNDHINKINEKTLTSLKELYQVVSSKNRPEPVSFIPIYYKVLSH